MRNDLTAAYVRSILDYDPETGVFTWRVSQRPGWVGKIAGSPSEGYLKIKIDGRLYSAHRIAWLHNYGEWPLDVIDHIDGNGLNNRIANLRDCSRAQNKANSRIYKNNKHGLKGVVYNKRRDGFYSTVQCNNKRIRTSIRSTPEEAHADYVEASERLFGEFARAA